MLILAGVSINAIVGDNGVIRQAQIAKISQKIATYKEEFAMNASVKMVGDKVVALDRITAINNNVKKYIPSLESKDLELIAIIDGELYYLGENEIERHAYEKQGFLLKPEDIALEDFKQNIEKQAIESIIKDMSGNAFTTTDSETNEEREIGVRLWDKNFENGNKWKIITEVENNATKATYGTGWYYIEYGTEIENIGNLTHSYIINYEEERAVKFDSTKHTMLAYGGNLAVTDNLIFNADPINIESGSAEAFGDGVELIGYENPTEAFTDTAFKFDGVDDYIKVPYDKNNNIENGFTYEFYGKINGAGMSYTNNGEILSTEKYDGLFCLWNGNEAMQALLRFGFHMNETGINDIFYNVGAVGKSYTSDFSATGYIWNQIIRFSDYDKEILFGDEFYYSINIDFNNHIQTIYLNGEKLDGGYISEEQCQYFLNTDLPKLNTFCFGRCSQVNEGYWHYSNADIYSLRFYGRSLSEEEAKANYNATIAYHDILVGGGNAETGGETGDTGLDIIE